MKKGSQHIAFDTLLALYHKELSLREVHQYKKHLETCEVCQDLLDGIKAFDTELLLPQTQFSEKPLEEKLLKIDKQYVRQTRYKTIRGNLLKCFPFLAASVFLIFFFPVNINPFEEMDKIIQAENEVSTPIVKTIKNSQTKHNEDVVGQQNSNNNPLKKRNEKANTSKTEQPSTEKQVPNFRNSLRRGVASGLVKQPKSSDMMVESLPENDDLDNEDNEIASRIKSLIINNLEKINTTKIPDEIEINLAPIQPIYVVQYDKTTQEAPVTSRFYAQYGLSYMVNTAKRNRDEIPLSQRIQSDTLIGSKISEHLVDAYSSVTGLDLAFGYQFSRHVGLELGTSYIYSKENLIDIETTERNYDRLYVTNKRFTLSPAIILQGEGKKWQPFARFGLSIPVAGETQRRRVSNEASLVHTFISYVKLDTDSKPANADFESDSVIKWRSTLGYSGALGLRYRLNENFEMFGMAGYTGLFLREKTYKLHHADLISDGGIRTDVLPIMHIFAPQNYTNESVDFSTVNFSIGARFNFGKRI